MEQLTEILNSVMAWAQDNPAMVTNGLAGAVLGVVLSKVLRGGFLSGLVVGVIGGVVAGMGIDQTKYADLIGNDGLMSYVQNVVEGAIGGVLGGGSGLATRKRD